ncbi:MAG: EAL domain-containing protein [Clostridium sp.]|nr:EAL domain-containing protein [Clostridium sp.]MCM1399748.1 EAL domain-containing protein [Clostridium sp.]MCM1460417.1 EAL domain-containing protein [Bacteroides sp.]
MTSTNYANGTDVATFVLETDAPYNILDFDQGLCLMTGYSPRELSKNICTLDNLLFVDDFAETIASINYQLSISNLISFQNRIVTKHGAVLTVLCNGQAYTLNDGRDVLQCVFTDITNLENAANETAQAKTDLEIFANTVPSGVSKHLLDNNLSLIWANNFFYDMCGYTENSFKEACGKNTLAIVWSEDLAIVIDVLADLTEDKNSKIANFRVKCADGSIKWVNAIFARSGENAEGFPILNLVMSDITNLKIAEMKARLEEQKYLIIADISEELPYEYDIAEDTITFAEKFNKIFDADPILYNPAVSMISLGLVSSDTKDAFDELFMLAKSGTAFHSTEFKLNTRNSGFQWFFSTFSTIYDEDQKPIRVVGLLRNINIQKTEQQKLLMKAETDLMTGLLNKAVTESKIKAHLRELDGNVYNVFMLVDIDDFKKVNDTYGHLKGDEVIVNIADTLKEYAGEYDLAGRLGGDEFCVYFSNLLDTQVACEKAEQIANRIRELYPGTDSCKVTLSIGIAFTNEPLPYDVLLERADTALYQAKLNGKNCYYCYRDDMERATYENERSSTTPSPADQVVSELLTMLFSGNNTHMSIGKSLDLIGSSYDIDKICIWEYCPEDKFVDCTHQWCREGIPNDRHVKQHTPATIFEELDSMGMDGVAYNSDTSLIKLNSSSMNPYSEGIKRLIQSQILLEGNVIGYISFYSMNNDMVWSTSTISSFKLIFKLLGEAVCAKKSSQHMSLLRENTISAFDIIEAPIAIIDKDSYDIMYFNETAKEYFPNLSMGSKCYNCMYQASGPCRDCAVHKMSEDTTAKCVKHCKATNETLDVYMSPINWSTGGSSFVLIFNMHKQTKSERLKQELEQNIDIEKKIAEASYRDIITGYGNFEKFKVTAQDILDNNPDDDYVMFYFNIRNFKYINEAYGHGTGDLTLKTVADVLNKHLAEGEAFARIIGDTYIMLIRDQKNHTYMDVYNSIRNEVHDACNIIQDRFVVDFTTGILLIDESMHSYSVNRLVDRAMMAAKNINAATGVAYAFYDDAYHKTMLNDAHIENSMHAALDNKEFCAYVQPKYDISNDKLIGGELLVRWLSPSKGFLEPSAFIPSFEKNGFIYQIDCFMLEEACKSLRRYLDTNVCALPFSVNLSRITIAHPDFLDSVQEIVEQYCIPHHYIEFEITESILVEDYDYMIDVLGRLHSMDFSINMDDFGTGYSSLTLLRDLPVDVIKLDHDFLARSAANDKNAVYILKCIIDMAHNLDIRVVSEGIEASDQLEMLKELGCEIGQGFLFAKPMPISDYDKLVKKYIE